MDIAVVTGASSGLGLAISRRLLSLGFRVYGLGGNYNDFPLQNLEFRPVSCDLADPGHVEHKAREILEKEGAVALLVNNAKLYPADSMDEGAGGEFSRSLNINLLCPLILVRTFLPGLQRVRGKVITINPATPETARGGPAGAACAGGLRWMNEVLFQQYRDQGITFSSISPEPNRWRPADAPRPKTDKPQSAIDPQAVADAVESIVQQTRGNLISEVVIRPERLTESTIAPMREVPYPKPKPIPYTVPRELIEAEEQLDREEEDRQHNHGDNGNEDDGEGRKRGRRRRRRRRGDGPDDERESGEEQSESPRSGRDRPRRERSPRNERSREAPATETAPEGAPAEKSHSQDPAPAAENPPREGGGRRRRRGRKPRPASHEERHVPSHSPRPGPIEATVPADPPPPARPEQPKVTPKPTAAEAQTKPVKKAAAKKAARKTPAKKTATKKTPAKKAAKKATAKKATKKAARKTTKKAVKKAAKKATSRKVARKAVAAESASTES